MIGLEPNALQKVAKAIWLILNLDYYTQDIEGIFYLKELIRIHSRWIHGRRNDVLILPMYATHLKVIRKSAFLDVGLYDESINYAQDYELVLRMSHGHRFGTVPRFCTTTGFMERKLAKLNNEEQNMHAVNA